MAIDNLIRATLAGFALTLLLVLTGCPFPCIEANYSFNVTADVYPTEDSVQIGDTIYITSVFPKQLTDQVTNQIVDYSNAKRIGSTLGLVRLEKTNQRVNDAVKDFNYVVISGNVYSDKSIALFERVQQTSYAEKVDNYKLRIGIVPQRTGVYNMGIGNPVSSGRSTSNSCEKAEFQMQISNSNKHFEYFEEYTGNPVPDLSLGNNYCFKVVDKLR